MDMQLLLRLDRMTPPRLLTLHADIAAAKRLVDLGMIEASTHYRPGKSSIGSHFTNVKVLTARGSFAVAQEKARTRTKSSDA